MEPHQYRKQLPPLIPPFRHCLVEENVYRGSHPSLKNYRYLRRLKLKTILSLVIEPTGPTSDLSEYCKSENIRHVWHYVEKYNDGFAHTPQLVASVLSQLIDCRNHPLLIHCRDGSHNTGLVIMCLRRLQNWSLPNIFQEFTRYTKSNDITFEEKQFVESFREPVTVPLHIPKWLWEGVRHSSHPTIELRLESDPGLFSFGSLSPIATQPSLVMVDEANATVDQMNTAMKPIIRTRPVCVQIRTHKTISLVALDLCGVNFLRCCHPDIDGIIASPTAHG